MQDLVINHLAVFTAALSDFAVGGLWFSPLLFYKPWMKANGFTEASLQKGNPAVIFGLTFIFSLIISYNLAFFLGNPETDAVWGMTAGFLAGLGWAAMGMGIITLFERRPWSYFFIHASYLTVAFTLKGLIIGAWR